MRHERNEVTKSVQVSTTGRVMKLTLNRPEAMNAISTELVEGLIDGLGQAAKEDGIGAVVICAQGSVFCAGADLKEAGAKASDPAEFRAWVRLWMDGFASIDRMPKPVIAAVRGLAVAGGLELVLSCDAVIASSAARFGDVHINYGLVPGGGGSKRLPDAVGSRMARWLMYTGQMIDAAEALEIGLVQSVIPDDGFDAAVDDIMAQMAQRSPAALSFMKFHSSPNVTLEQLDHEVEAAVGVVTGLDAREGLKAFVEKRRPNFPSIAG